MNIGFFFHVSVRQLWPGTDWGGVCYKCAHHLYYHHYMGEVVGDLAEEELVRLWSTLA